MRRSQNWLPRLPMALGALTTPVAALADLVCPLCDAEPIVMLGATEVVQLVLTTVMFKGVAILLLGSTAIVSLPWLVAGVAVALFYLPRWLKASS